MSETMPTVEQALAEVLSEKARAPAEKARVDEHLDRLNIQEDVLRSFVSRYNRLASLPSTEPGSDSRQLGAVLSAADLGNQLVASFQQFRVRSDQRASWQILTLTDAVRKVLANAHKPLSPTEVSDALDSAGRSDSNDSVRATLKHLKDKGIAVARTRSNWVLVGGPLDTGPEVPEVDPALYPNGEDARDYFLRDSAASVAVDYNVAADYKESPL